MTRLNVKRNSCSVQASDWKQVVHASGWFRVFMIAATPWDRIQFQGNKNSDNFCHSRRVDLPESYKEATMAKKNPGDILGCDWNPIIGCERYSAGCAGCWYLDGIFPWQQLMADILARRYPDGLPPYLAAAVSVEDQETADERLPHGSCIAPTAPPTTQAAPAAVAIWSITGNR